jgi:hypothetical protein
VRLDRRQRSPGLHLSVNGRHLLVSQVQLLLVRLRLLLLLLLRLVPRERSLLGWAVFLYLGHKVNNYSPIEQINFRIRSQMKAGTSLSLCPENSYL